MKSLGKLLINTSKLLNNEELINFRGGTEGSSNWECGVWCDVYYEPWFQFSSTCEPWDTGCAQDQCATFYGQQFQNCYCLCNSYYPYWQLKANELLQLIEHFVFIPVPYVELFIMKVTFFINLFYSISIGVIIGKWFLMIYKIYIALGLYTESLIV